MSVYVTVKDNALYLHADGWPDADSIHLELCYEDALTGEKKTKELWNVTVATALPGLSPVHLTGGEENASVVITYDAVRQEEVPLSLPAVSRWVRYKVKPTLFGWSRLTAVTNCPGLWLWVRWKDQTQGLYLGGSRGNWYLPARGPFTLFTGDKRIRIEGK